MKFTHYLYKRIFVAAAALAVATASMAADYNEIAATPGKAGGVYYAYPVTESANTPAPKGYKPFYISHYGRHGSRYLIFENEYTGALRTLQKAAEANALTPYGQDVLARLDSVWMQAKGRLGELTMLGNNQHREIAHRMANAFPEVFAQGAKMTAYSTPVMRCAHSMFSFIEGLKDKYPYLEIPRESAERQKEYMNFHGKEWEKFASHSGPWYQRWKRFRDEQTHPDRLMSALFSDAEYVATWIDPTDLMWQIYWEVVGQQNIGSTVSLADLLTDEELYDMWQVNNYNFFAQNSSYADANHLNEDNARNLAADILAKAEAAVESGSHGADLRFGHDSCITPLAALLQLDNCYTDVTDPHKLAENWCDFNVSPMAANLQIVLFKNSKGDVIGKFMLNEREIAIPAHTDNFPFYSWETIKAHFENILK